MRWPCRISETIKERIEKNIEEQVDLCDRLTHRSLWEALMAEPSQCSLEEITVQQICKRATVHDPTFYWPAYTEALGRG